MSRISRIKSSALIASAAAATVLVGTLGGATMALWHDDAAFTSQTQTGKVAFAVGAPGQSLAKSATTAGQTLSFTFGKDAAATLLAQKKVAIPIQVDSLSQGNKGMRYTVAPPTFAAGSVFAAAQTALVRVGSASDCKMDPAEQPHSNYTRTPVSSDYSNTATPTSEFWCLTASLDAAPGAGNYSNTATVTATPKAGAGTGAVTDSDQWWANVTSTADSAKEPEHKIDFTFATFRPGK